MTERMRFRARYPRNPHVEVGARVIFDPVVLYEEWSMGAMQRPDRIDPATARPRPGDVIKIIAPDPPLGRTWWEVWAEDPAAHVTTVEVLLTLLGDRVLATPGRIKALLEHLASTTIHTDAEGADVARACDEWLSARFPGIARAAEHVPDYDDDERMEAWVEGVAAALGHWPDRQVAVPVPPFTLVRDQPAAPLVTSENLRVRPDVVNRLYGGHRAN